MIGRLQGTLAGKSPPQVLVDVNGVGYDVDVPMSTFFNLPAVGERVTLLTHFVVREDAQVLFGFLTAAERQTFRELIRISGVGPRTALSILSGLNVDDLARAVQQQDAVRLVGADLCEVAPALDHADITSHLGVAVLHEALAVMAIDRLHAGG